MHISSTKASLLLNAQTQNNYSVQALFGEIPKNHQLYINEHAVIDAHSSELLSQQQLYQTHKYVRTADREVTLSVSRFNQTEKILTENLLFDIHRYYRQLVKQYGFGFSAQFIIDALNNIICIDIKYTAQQVHSFHQHGPHLSKFSTKKEKLPKPVPTRLLKPSRLARHHASKTLGLFSDATPQPQNRHHFTEHHQHDQTSFGISFLDAKKTIATILERNSDGRSFEDYLLNYIVHEKKIAQQTPILYQSLALSTRQQDNAIFSRELRLLYQLLHTYRYQQIILSLPLIRSTEQIHKIKQQIRTAGLTRSPRFKIFLAIQIPSQILLLDQFIDTDIDGLLFDTPTLIKLFFAADPELAPLQSERFLNDPAIHKTLEKVA